MTHCFSFIILYIFSFSYDNIYKSPSGLVSSTVAGLPLTIEVAIFGSPLSLSVRLVFAAQAVRVGFHLCRQSNLSYNRKYDWYDVTIGQAYVNVHTEQNSDGEIRGTIEVDLD